MNATPKPSRWLPGTATLLAALSCYGTTALIAMLSALGVSVALDERVWAGAISVFATLAAVTVVAAYPRHRAAGPAVLAVIGLGLILWAMYGSYSRPVELGGFLALAAAAAWDWRSRKGRQQPDDGIAWIEPDALAERLAHAARPTVVDVRAPDEFDGELGHVAGARNIPIDALAGRIEELAPFKRGEVVLVCRTQMRSAKAAAVLRQAGFANTAVLRGGMLEWARRQLPVAGDRTATG